MVYQSIYSKKIHQSSGTCRYMYILIWHSFGCHMCIRGLFYIGDPTVYLVPTWKNLNFSRSTDTVGWPLHWKNNSFPNGIATGARNLPNVSCTLQLVPQMFWWVLKSRNHSQTTFPKFFSDPKLNLNVKTVVYKPP